MAATQVGYSSANLAFERLRRGPSLNIWKNFPRLRCLEDPTIGSIVFEDFTTWISGAAVASNGVTYQASNTGWHSFESTTTSNILPSNTDFPIPGSGATGVGSAGSALGVIKMKNVTTAHNAAILEYGGGILGASATGPYGLGSNAAVTVPGAGSLPKLYFEARVRFTVAAGMACFIGLAAPGAAASAIITISAADVFTANLNEIGFALCPVASTGLATNATALQPFYSSAAITSASATSTTFAGNVGGIPSAANYPGTTLFTPVTAGLLTDFTKLGFLIDPQAVDGIALKFYQDGVLLAQQNLSQIVAANWPSNAALTPTLVCKSAPATTAVEMDVDWVQIGQVLSPE